LVLAELVRIQLAAEEEVRKRVRVGQHLRTGARVCGVRFVGVWAGCGDARPPPGGGGGH
jgi:hypothetical protein